MHALQEGATALQGLLAMLTASLQTAHANTVSSHADSLWGFMLRVLDVRQRLSGGNEAPVPAGSVASIEAAVVEAMVVAVLKLSEAKFKPLFLRLLDWASSPPAATPGTDCCVICCCVA